MLRVTSLTHLLMKTLITLQTTQNYNTTRLINCLPGSLVYDYLTSYLKSLRV